MILPGKELTAFSFNTVNDSFFTGHMNLQDLNFDPLVTGYAFIIWTKLPKWVTNFAPKFKELTQRNFKSFDGLADIELQTAAYEQSFNNNEYNYATTISKQNTEFTLKHQEFSGNPIKNMYQFWVSGIRDPDTDIATYPKAFGIDYAAKNHTGELLYVVTRPDANNFNNSEIHNIEFAAYYTNVMPTKIPIAHFEYSQGEHNSPEIDIPFKGNLHIGPKVDAFARAKLAEEQCIFNFEDNFNPDNSQELGSRGNESYEASGQIESKDIIGISNG